MDKRGKIQRAADAVGANQAAVRRALKQTGTEDAGLEDIIEIARANVDAERAVGHAANGRGEGGDGPMSALTRAKLRKAELDNQKSEIELAKAANELINRETVTRVGVHLITAARTALLSLSHRLAPKVAGKADIGELSRIIETEVRDVLGTLADEKQFLTAIEDEALT